MLRPAADLNDVSTVAVQVVRFRNSPARWNMNIGAPTVAEYTTIPGGEIDTVPGSDVKSSGATGKGA